MIAVDSIFKIKRYYKTFGIRQFERAQHCVRVCYALIGEVKHPDCVETRLINKIVSDRFSRYDR